jgi:hypothetical protein
VRAVNLVPPELRSRVPGDGDPRIAYGVFGGLVLLLVMVLVSVSYSNKATTLNDEAAALQAQAARHQTKAAPVQAFNDFAGVAQSRTLLVGGLAASRFPWGNALFNLSKSLPADVTIDSMNAVTAEQTAAAANQSTGSTAVAAASEPTLELTGCTSSWIGYSRLTVWLKNMPGVRDVTSSQSSASGPVAQAAAGGENADGARKNNCGPAPLKFTTKIFYQPREVDLVGLPKISAPEAPGASGAVGATPAAGAPAAATTPPAAK